MRKLNHQELIDILVGATILGTGGGGSLERGIEKIERALAQLNPFAKVGCPVSIVVLPAAKEWTTPRGLEVFGPRSFGHDVDYLPYCE